jgi:hypothetical protein
MWGAALAGVGQLAGGLFSYFAAPKTPKYDTKSAGVRIDDYTNRIESIFGGPAQQTQFKWNMDAGLADVQKGVNFNARNLDTFANMADRSYKADVESKLEALDVVSPGWRETRDAATVVNQSLTRGEIPNDVKRMMERQSAQGAQLGGYGNSGMGRNYLAADLGKTSVDLSTLGQTQAMDWLKTLDGVLPEQTTAFDVMKFAGVSGDMVLGTSLGAAELQLENEMGNADRQLRQKAGLAAGYSTVLNAQLDNIANKYTSDMGVKNAQQARVNALGNSFGDAMGSFGGMFGGQSTVQQVKSSYGWNAA